MRIRPTSCNALRKFVEKQDCVFIRQKGSHLVFWRDGLNRPVVIPAYKNVPVFIIQEILRQLGVSREEYLRTIRKLR